MKITFEDVDLTGCVKQMHRLLADLTPEEKPKPKAKPPAEAPVEEPAKKSRRKTNRPAAKVTPKADPGLSDADVAKAASLAAGTIKPKVVKEILSQFGVANVNKLEGDQRQEFIDLLKEATNAVS
jgi:hypothetical protein